MGVACICGNEPAFFCFMRSSKNAGAPPALWEEGPQQAPSQHAVGDNHTQYRALPGARTIAAVKCGAARCSAVRCGPPPTRAAHHAQPSGRPRWRRGAPRGAGEKEKGARDGRDRGAQGRGVCVHRKASPVNGLVTSVRFRSSDGPPACSASRAKTNDNGRILLARGKM